MTKIALITGALVFLGAIIWLWKINSSRGSREGQPITDSTTDPQANESQLSMDAEEKAFILRLDGRASFAEQKIPLRGKLQIYVRRGSQYATWRQFPSAIRFEVRNASGKVGMTPDLTRSISDSQQTYARYAAQPADEIIGKNFEIDVFQKLATSAMSKAPLISGPGSYQIRAVYWSHVSNWVDVEMGD